MSRKIRDLPRDIFQGWDVLVVDDDPMSLDVARLMLKFYSASVHTASDGREGQEKAIKLLPRFIVSDLSMPEVDGWQMIASLKMDIRTREIPIIALTAHAMTGDRERAIAAGCHNYLTKPLNPDSFIMELVSVLIDIPSFDLSLSRKDDARDTP
jgi:CheY-like chemotaxis protein